MMARRKTTDRVQLPVRMQEALRARLEKAAKARGVSLNAEAVGRLERSFEGERQVEELLGGPEIFGLLMIIGRAMKETGQTAGMWSAFKLEGANAWLANPYAFDQAVKAVNGILEALRPPGEIKAPDFQDERLRAIAGDLGASFARTGSDAVAEPKRAPTEELQRWGADVQKRLGAVAEHLRKDRDNE